MFQSGEVVQLKSGGPMMTVKKQDNDGEYECAWFDGSDLKVGYFAEALLRKVDATASMPLVAGGPGRGRR